MIILLIGPKKFIQLVEMIVSGENDKEPTKWSLGLVSDYNKVHRYKVNKKVNWFLYIYYE